MRQGYLSPLPLVLAFQLDFVLRLLERATSLTAASIHVHATTKIGIIVRAKRRARNRDTDCAIGNVVPLFLNWVYANAARTRACTYSSSSTPAPRQRAITQYGVLPTFHIPLGVRLPRIYILTFFFGGTY